jgi:histidinol-phosphate aminotransferase
VILLDPTYPFLYNLAEISAAEVVLARSPDALFESARSVGRGMTVLVNPSNPTGEWLPPEQVLRSAPDAGVFIIDEAYASFAPSSALDSLKSRANCIVVRSFSKSYALAGVRVGYAIGSEELISRLAAVQDPYPISSLAVAAGLAALEDEQYYSGCIASVLVERARLAQGLHDLGWEVRESHANFVFGEPPPGTVLAMTDLLRGEHIHVRTFERASWGLRISVGLPQQNDAALRALRSLPG